MRYGWFFFFFMMKIKIRLFELRVAQEEEKAMKDRNE
jgi:hypothetical protein